MTTRGPRTLVRDFLGLRRSGPGGPHAGRAAGSGGSAVPGGRPRAQRMVRPQAAVESADPCHIRREPHGGRYREDARPALAARLVPGARCQRGRGHAGYGEDETALYRQWFGSEAVFTGSDRRRECARQAGADTIWPSWTTAFSTGAFPARWTSCSSPPKIRGGCACCQGDRTGSPSPQQDVPPTSS